MLPKFNWSLYLNTWGIWQYKHIVPSSEPSGISASSAQARWRRQRALWRWCWCSRARACTPPRTFRFFQLLHCSGPVLCLGFERESVDASKSKRRTNPKQKFDNYFNAVTCTSVHLFVDLLQAVGLVHKVEEHPDKRTKCLGNTGRLFLLALQCSVPKWKKAY